MCTDHAESGPVNATLNATIASEPRDVNSRRAGLCALQTVLHMLDDRIGPIRRTGGVNAHMAISGWSDFSVSGTRRQY